MISRKTSPSRLLTTRLAESLIMKMIETIPTELVKLDRPISVIYMYMPPEPYTKHNKSEIGQVIDDIIRNYLIPKIETIRKKVQAGFSQGVKVSDLHPQNHAATRVLLYGDTCGGAKYKGGHSQHQE